MQKNKKKRNVVAVLAGVAVATAVAASAATLGGITTDWLGADNADVTSPVTDGLTVKWTPAFDEATGAYKVEQFTLVSEADQLTGVSADMVEVRLELTVPGVTGDSSTSWTGALPDAVSGDTITVTPGDAIPAEHVTGIAVLINGTPVEASGL